MSIWWLPFWKFWQFLPQGLPKNAWMVMKLCENLKSNKIYIIYDNEHYCNKWLFRKATKIIFFSALLEKSQFSLKIYPLKITSQKKSNSKFLWRCWFEIQNIQFTFSTKKNKNKKEQKSPKIWAHGGKNSCLATAFSQ